MELKQVCNTQGWKSNAFSEYIKIIFICDFFAFENQQEFIEMIEKIEKNHGFSITEFVISNDLNNILDN